MDIYWLGHSCFRIKGRDATIITDPYSPDLGYSLGQPTANIITVSHQHPNHAYVQGISGEPRVISGPGEYEIGGVLILGIATSQGSEGNSKLGKNTAYLMEIDGVSICHLGNLKQVLTAEQVEEVEDVDVLLLPVGGGVTINAAVAAEVVRQLTPKLVIPMHYQTEGNDPELDPVAGFLKEIGADQIPPQPKLSVTKSNLPATMQVFLLSY
ncbi:MAG: MBL fold metallo-hydrolase [Dehalococcoidales bacterium]|nr:MBL fold metallo-hydrolase [Dehalococcoidales bacterium]